MNPSLGTAAPSRLARRLVLGTAFLLGLAFALAPETPTVRAQDTKAAQPASPPKAPAGKSMSITDGSSSVTITSGAGQSKVEVKDGTETGAADADVDSGSPPPPRRSGKRARIEIEGLGDREFDSFGDFVHHEPEMAGMIVAIVAVVFLAPVLAIGLILWYRMRKARMLNETMLKLAERGVVTPAEALEALSGTKSVAATVAAAQAASPVYDPARQIRRRAAWSDLRKGVITGGIGLALTLYSLFDDRSPNGLGLVLLFVGVGFVVLWWFEERQLAPPAPLSDFGREARPPGGPPATPPSAV